MANDDWLTTKEAAAYIKMSASFLEKDRMTGRAGVPFIWASDRTVRYVRSDLDAWKRSRPKGHAKQSKTVKEEESDTPDSEE